MNKDQDLGLWLQGLRAPERVQRLHAANILGAMGPEAQAAVPALIEALKDDDLQVRRVITAALWEIGPAAKSAAPALATALRDRSAIVRRRAAFALAELGPAARLAVPALMEALADVHIMVRRAAAHALGQIGAKALPAVPALVQLLKGPEAATQMLASCALVKIGPEAVPSLLPFLTDDDPLVRRHVVQVLGKLNQEREQLLPALRTAALDGDGAVREAVAAASQHVR